MIYKNLEQRIAKTYLETFPPFVPYEGDEVTLSAEQDMYNFLHDYYFTLYQTPEILFPVLNVDDSYPNIYNRSSYHKPELFMQMKKDWKLVEGFIEFLFQAGKNDYLMDDNTFELHCGPKVIKKIKNKYINIMDYLGLSIVEDRLLSHKYKELISAIKWMASKENITYLKFSRCMFNDNHSYAKDIFVPFFNLETFNKLDRFFTSIGYYFCDLRKNVYNYGINLGYYSLPLQPKDAVHSHAFMGLSFVYNEFATVPQSSFINFKYMKELYLNYDNLPHSLQSFLVSHSEYCHSCGYCIFNKFEKFSPKFVPAKLDNHEYKLCPVHSKFYYTFTSLDDDTVDHIIELFQYITENMNVVFGKD